ncbi:MAG: hypothetical protein Q7W54_13085, partial [Bacteroidota bacterium]|nr:hypothetical protein [Bacteroidota bacterium]
MHLYYTGQDREQGGHRVSSLDRSFAATKTKLPMDIAQRFPRNPLIRPADLKPGIEGMEILCLLNPGVFQFEGKIWLLLRVAERP